LHLPYEYVYNIRNPVHLITEINENMVMCSFDIENMYTNIPKLDTTSINIINSVLNLNTEINKNSQKEIKYVPKTVIEQNYFQFDQQYYKQTVGLAMGPNISNISIK
jgi:hypothetical protein